MMPRCGNAICITGPIVRGVHWSPADSPHKAPVRQGFDFYFAVNTNKLLIKQSSG